MNSIENLLVTIIALVSILQYYLRSMTMKMMLIEDLGDFYTRVH